MKVKEKILNENMIFYPKEKTETHDKFAFAVCSVE